MVSGLQFLDANKVMHRDLKPQNLLVKKRILLFFSEMIQIRFLFLSKLQLTALELDATLKLADFGFARLLDNSNLIMQSVRYF